MHNKEMARRLKEHLSLRYEPVAVKLVRVGEDPPAGLQVPDKQMSHCQSVMAARKGQRLLLPMEAHSCHNGASALGMCDVPEKTASGEFYSGSGMFSSPAAAKLMTDARACVPFKVTHTAVAPLRDADFVPDVVVFADVPERIYWLMPMSLYHEGGRADFNTAPYNAACVDVVARPLETGRMNISIGCFGCRKRTDISADEMLAGIPYTAMPRLMEALDALAADVIVKAKRE